MLVLIQTKLLHPNKWMCLKLKVGNDFYTFDYWWQIMSRLAYFFYWFWNGIHIEEVFFFLCPVTIYSKCNFLVHCCYSKLRICVLFGVTEIQCSYYLNKFICHFCGRLSFSFTTGDSQLWLGSGYLCSCLGRKKGTTSTSWRTGGKAVSGTWVGCVQQNTYRNTVCLGTFSFSPSALSLSKHKPYLWND